MKWIVRRKKLWWLHTDLLKLLHQAKKQRGDLDDIIATFENYEKELIDKINCDTLIKDA